MRHILMCAVLLASGGCAMLAGPKVECHMEVVKGPPASVVPPDSLHLPTVTFQIVSQRRVCTRT